MLSQEDNELLTRIGQGTPMGEMLRQYWLPFMLSSELPEQDGPPKRVRLLGEDLIAFRDTANRVGLLANNCSHRGASLFYARNEDEGLRCVYHGWKYDVEGNCVDMPNEPPESNFRDKIHHRAYPCQERNGVLWTYMGPRTAPPSLPDVEWNLVPEGQYQIQPFLRECNFVQALEGDIDTVHSVYLHGSLDIGTYQPGSTALYRARNHQPRMDVVDTPYGLVYAGVYEAGPDTNAYRLSQFMFPIFTHFPAGTTGIVPGHVWIPVDDYHTLVWQLRWHPSRPLAEAGALGPEARGGGLESSFATSIGYAPPTSDWLGRWRFKPNKTNDYLLDYELQRTTRFCGIPGGAAPQDQAMTESMGPVMDRTAEHLGTTDSAIIRMRARLLAAVKALRDDGAVPPGVDEPSIFRTRSAQVVLPKDANWFEVTNDWVTARTDAPPASVGSE